MKSRIEVLEGVLKIDEHDYMGGASVNKYCLSDLFEDHNGKRIRVTVQVLDEEEQEKDWET